MPSADINQWLDELEEPNLLRRKCGGFVWLHAPTRGRLRDLFALDAEALNLSQDDVKTRVPLNDPSRISRTFLAAAELFASTAATHRRLAKWYRDVFTCSRRPEAVFEALYHASEAAILLATQKKADEVSEELRWSHSVFNGAHAIIRKTGFSRRSCRPV